MMMPLSTARVLKITVITGGNASVPLELVFCIVKVKMNVCDFGGIVVCVPNIYVCTRTRI